MTKKLKYTITTSRPVDNDDAAGLQVLSLEGVVKIVNSQQGHEGRASDGNAKPTQLPPTPNKLPTIHNRPKWSKLQVVKIVIVWMAGSDAVIIAGVLNEWHAGWYVLWLIAMTLLLFAARFVAMKFFHLSTFLRKKLTRPPDPDQPIATPEEDECYYFEDPHLTMFMNRAALQILLWIVTFVVCWFLLQDQTSLWPNVLAQYIISQINLYFIIRGYLTWDGIDHKITRDNYIRTQTEDLFFLIRREPILSISKQTLVNARRDKRTLTEFWPFKERGTIVITEQDQRKEPRRIGFIKYPDKFVAAINAR